MRAINKRVVFAIAGFSILHAFVAFLLMAITAGQSAGLVSEFINFLLMPLYPLVGMIQAERDSMGRIQITYALIAWNLFFLAVNSCLWGLVVGTIWARFWPRARADKE
jgi:hypothetical protein